MTDLSNCSHWSENGIITIQASEDELDDGDNVSDIPSYPLLTDKCLSENSSDSEFSDGGGFRDDLPPVIFYNDDIIL